jgi:hypothetical protein
LYGTTFEGGAWSNYAGTVFELTPEANGDWKEKILHSFNPLDGIYLNGGLIFDAAGNLYGTTQQDGLNGYYGGTVFELTLGAKGTWTETVLHNFDDNGTDGFWPTGNLIFDAAGNLYGTSDVGGAYCTAGGGFGCGTVFEVNTSDSTGSISLGRR